MVLRGSNETGLLVAQSVHLEESFGFVGGAIHDLTKLKGDYGIMGTVDDEDGRGDCAQARRSVELTADQ